MAELLFGMALAVNTIFAVTACMADALAETHRILFAERTNEAEKQWREDVFDSWKR